ncbi:HEAT repeat domain-containing protein [Methanoregula sp.]|uniref:HEAT repeat domain-containing protein n=1 Tax=Methanoregula sp. TaxID=2052170 RepID=UPI003C752AF8
MGFLRSEPADIENLKKVGDVPALIRLMGHADPQVRREAAGALGTAGVSAVPPLQAALRSPDPRIRLGATEALGTIRNCRAAGALLELLRREKFIEIRWAAVLALGETGCMEAIPDLALLLKDLNKYIRYGAARSLEKLGWQASGETDLIYFSIALQDWDSVKKYGPAAIPPLSCMFHDTDPGTRSGIITLLGELGELDPHTTCRAGLRDRDPGVRWTAVLSAMNCGIRSIHLPPLVAGRERTGPDPAAAALLNFLFLGIGYNYIGKWWGFPVFMTYMSVIVLAQLYAGPFLPYLAASPITAVLGIHTYYMTERMADL